MKSIRWFILLLTLVLCAGCSSPAQTVVLNRRNSYYMDMELSDNVIKLRYAFELTNAADSEKEVTLTIRLPEDVDGGLLCDESLSQTFQVHPGTDMYDVTFEGKFAGTFVKQNRLLPDSVQISIH